MLNQLATDELVRDRHNDLRDAAARHRTARRVSHHPAVRAWMGWLLVRAGWRLAASGRRTNVTICGRTTL
jgi:hypothetical protein